MKTLYFVALYNHRRNEWARLLLTAESQDKAREAAEAGLNDNLEGRTWKAKTVQAICPTPVNNIWTEI
jgi:hypothetical protein